MDEELNEEVIEDPEVTQDQPTEIEKLAMEIGWNPDFEGEGAKTAEEYIKNSREIQDTMRDLMRKQTTTISELKSGIDAINKHNQNVYKAEVANLQAKITQLKAEKRDAIEEGDVEKVEQIDNQIDGINQIPATPAAQPAPTQPDPEFVKWHKQNTWYQTDPEMTAVADEIYEKLPKSLPTSRVFKKINEQMSELYPDVIKPKAPPAVPSVEGAGQVRGKTKKTKYTPKDLSHEQMTMAKQFLEMGAVKDIQEYVNDLAKLGQIGEE
jgi:hypothetical protein